MERLNIKSFLAISVALTISCHAAAAYRFLVINAVSAHSHHAVISSLAYGLTRKGHEVTMMTPMPPPAEQLRNFEHIKLKTLAEAAEARSANLFEERSTSAWHTNSHLQALMLTATQAVLEEPAVIKFLHSNRTFDAVVCEVFQTDALFGFSEHFNAPLIGVGPFGNIAWNTDMVGSPSPPSYLPHSFLPATHPMTLQQRIGNLIFLTYEHLVLEWHALPKHEALYEKHFPSAKRALRAVRSDAALVLLNTHFALGVTRPYVPNQIEVGGMHIARERKPLPALLLRFMDEAEDGVIYFSMGSYMRSKLMPSAQRQAILDGFRALKQRVVWKFEDTNLKDKPDNVFISPWLPQDDVLAHPNVRLFITHGGMLSITEAIYHGVPLLGLPIYGDQPRNMARAELYGYGFKLNFRQLTSEIFYAAIEHVLNTPSFKQEMSLRSAQYRDQPLAPLDLAIYWSERVARHGQEGVKRLHCPGQDMSFIAYHNIDAWFVLIGAVVGILLLLVAMVRGFLRTVRFMFGGSKLKSR